MSDQFFKRLTAFALCLLLTMQVSVGAWAAETAEPDAAAVVETAEDETVLSENDAQVPETMVETETAVPEMQVQQVIETDTVSETETETTAETETETGTAVETETEMQETEVPETEQVKAEAQVIRGFAAIPDKQKSLTFSVSDKPSLEELAGYLPKTLKATLADGSRKEIEVTWKGPSDYEESSYFYYAFLPVWDEDLYTLDTDEELPYVWVQFTSDLLDAPVTDSGNEAKVYKYLTGTLKLKKAAALGIMANIEAESDYDSDLIEAGSHIGFGLLQWSFDRRTALESYLDKNGFPKDSIEGQLQYMMVELNQSYYNHILKKLQGVADSAQGAYEAGYYFCKYYEVPADAEAQSVARGARARDTYWPMYSGKNAVVDQNISISGHTLPGTQKAGDFFNIRGTISSASKLTSVSVGVYNTAGVMVIGKTVAPNTTSYSLINVDPQIKFGSLKAGIYRYKVTATDNRGSSTLINKIFAVLATGKTVSNGTYNIVLRDNTALGLSIKGKSKAHGANVLLNRTDASDNFMKYEITYQSDGYYRIKNVASGKYLGVDNQSSASGVKVSQMNKGTLWQILPDSKGGYNLVPKCGLTNTMYVAGGSAQAGKNIQVATQRMNALQCFKLLAPGAASKATISGQSLPGTMKTGKSFSIKGTVKSATNITSLTVGVFNAAGLMKIGKSVQPNARTYDLKKLDSVIKFSKLAAGIYSYRVIAKNTAGEVRLVDKKFAVLSSKQTVANGTYNILLNGNTAFGMGIAHNSKAKGGNVHLWKLSSTNKFMRYKVTYQSDGYYRIKNVGSGKYLGVVNQSGKSGKNVEQQNKGTLFQILSDGNGSYSLIPKCATGCAVHVKGDKAAKSQNIQIQSINGSSWQRWKLQKIASGTKATISGQTTPANMRAGTSFSIRGVIKSSTNLTKVSVGVYDKNGGGVIGKTVTPNAKSYDLRNVDTSIKFGTLKAGTYTYRVTATNSAGTVTLVSKQFTVK